MTCVQLPTTMYLCFRSSSTRLASRTQKMIAHRLSTRPTLFDEELVTISRHRVWRHPSSLSTCSSDTVLATQVSLLHTRDWKSQALHQKDIGPPQVVEHTTCFSTFLLDGCFDLSVCSRIIPSNCLSSQCKSYEGAHQKHLHTRCLDQNAIAETIV